MTESDYAQMIDELDHLLNDYDAPMKPDRVWSLLAEVSRHDLEAAAAPLSSNVSDGSYLG